ncbi:RagB/SusD family nutrient uptake outer membrane protein [Pedobacter hartonius]|uniref:SusD family protein n=1 Tax=Pedobacter hartonius TaxID=425514 RepID=A0A1H4CYC4_9SPHI|nr:RagB/SusD family nutrient uptake outer membrane protein [Pedobacter hartonius]SEA65424.1 SusD family protein [Pedobacter hartonius]
MKSKNILYIVFGIALIASSCKKFLEIAPPKTSAASESVFNTDDLATSAVLNMYSTMNGNSFAFGSSSVTFVGGLSSDELLNYGGLTAFYDDELSPANNTLTTLFDNPYSIIFKANSVLEGLDLSNGLTPSVKSQLQGEAYFVRAFTYFNLVNLFGPVPLNLNSDYRQNRANPRASIDQIYQQMINDLHLAEGLLTDQYVTTERVRPNLAAVQALLARVYLYNKDYVNAEKCASLIIAKTTTYSLVPLNNVFLKNSQEAIWQLFPPSNSSGFEGNIFILTNPPVVVSLRSAFVLNAFEANDKRKTSWVNSFTNSTGTYYFPYKYKVKSTVPSTEYSMVLRLGEQYLIRAEARAQQNNLTGAIDDLDKIRDRAGLPLLALINPTINKSDLLDAIQKERRVELFTEWGHRWFDLTRTGKATEVLTPLKPKWEPTDVLYPIPLAEITRNPNSSQNAGY